ncbi:S8 family serine peptidase [Nonomuraea sp. NEAU-A123]|uniref:S8 family serine peptidase n=1 Tax=Nonomuraea sp. NEAU-A123 TaxID=2839649 RepID=UPI001BE4286B|nr:S8 family serine peptidase [Nonomuraea sp. NEAU-A123]MBT2226836.1 S8 family serine peptidase [Nonomuraea sp. NEAU-A123]
MFHNRIAAVFTGLALVLCTTATPSSATPPNPKGTMADEPPKPGTVTLITGDVVDFTPGVNGGPPILATRAAPRPDGEPVTFATLPDRDGGTLVIPSDAADLVAAGTLDDELFDVETLVREHRAQAIPLIITYGGNPGETAVTKAADALPGTERTRTLDVIDGAAVTVKTAETGKLWSALQPQPAGLKANRPAKIWLDRRVKASLDQSVPLIGAPTAWQQGFDGAGTKVAVLDTGIDAGHPDFTGRIVATENFSTTPDTTDVVGHGTHVASTIAGSGAASDGKYRGVAPAASLLVGKVLDDYGYGELSWLIAGMEWASAQGADVVNMSLGVCCGDGTDPTSQAVNELTRKYGTLFVAAAGNEGEPQTVSVPAAADKALAVGAVDKITGTTLAPFSSIGPRLDDAAVKPNIVAPGVSIVAARSGASGQPSIPGNDRYTSFSGTSMATPHVAGAAAVLAQQHPDWDADELSAALVSTSARNEKHNWFEEGGGRLDLGRAVTQSVFADPVVDFLRLERGKGAVTKKVTYRNTGPEPITLALKADTRAWSGGPTPVGAIRLGAETVTVPANGTATVDLTVNPALGPEGAYGGWVTATAGDSRLATPFSYYTGPDTHLLKISLTNSYGAKEFSSRPGQGGRLGPLVYIVPLRRSNSPDDPFHPYAYYYGRLDLTGKGEQYLPDGDYEVIAVANETYMRTRTSLVIGNVTLKDDQTIDLDARDTVPLRPSSRDAMDAEGKVQYVRTFTDRPSPISITASTESGRHVDLYATPVPSVKAGTMSLSHMWQLEPGVLAAATAGRLTLDPSYEVDTVRSLITKPTTYPVVSAGQGRPADFAGLDVTGKLVLVGVPLGTGATPYSDATPLMDEASALAKQGGAAGFIGFYDADGAGTRLPGFADTRFLRFGLDAAQGRALRETVRQGTDTLRLTPYTGESTYYRLRYDEQGKIPRKPAKLDRDRLARVDTRYHADQPNAQGHLLVTTSAGASALSFGQWVTMPFERTEYYGPAGDDALWSRSVGNQGLELTSQETFARAGRTGEDWFKAPLVPGAAAVPARYPVTVPCALCRDGDRFVPAEQWLDSDPRHYSALSTVSSAPHLGVGGTEIPVKGWGPRSFTVPAGPSPYRLDTVDTSYRALSPKVTTGWRFTSSGDPSGTPRGYSCSFGPACAFQPALVLTYDLPVDLLNRAPSGRPLTFELTARPAAPSASPARSVRVEYSIDDGATWRQAENVRKLGDGRFRVRVLHPALAATSGFVSLRVNAEDKAGGTVTQTVDRAYRLK